MAGSSGGKTVLISGGTRDNGPPTFKDAISLGLYVRAMVNKEVFRSTAIETLGADIVLGDLLETGTVSAAMKGPEVAYFVWPFHRGLIHATVGSAQSAKEAGVAGILEFSRGFARRRCSPMSCSTTTGSPSR